MRYHNQLGKKPLAHILITLAWLTLQPHCLRADAPSQTTMPKRPAPAVTLFVATGGNDSNPGTHERPFATLERARDEIRKLKQRGPLPKGGIVVAISGGCYQVTKTFTLAAEDSGTAAAPIVYRAGGEEMPIFSGGLRLKDFKPVTDTAILKRLPEEARGKVVQVDLAAHGLKNIKPLILGGFSSGRGFITHPLKELFFEGRALPLARWPNEGFARIENVELDGHSIHGRSGRKTGRFTYQGDRPQRWKEDKDAMLYGYWFWGWADSYEPVESIDTKRREITLKPPYHKYGYRKGQPYHAINLLSEIDRPGEWYIDRDTSLLYLYPPSDPNKAVVMLSTFDHPFVEMKNVSHVSFERLVWEFGCGDAVHIIGGEHCLLAGCTIRHCGGNAVTI
ncbi:MAG: right-handed parallel beta-helix repeat-containing protein, partial [Pirellulales bacterium]|nr:right-handed parallel beta-helix repeat-containing protein [Pirellulales bacterium]